MTWRCEDGEWVGCNDACGTNGAGEPPPLPCTQWDVYDGYCGNLFGGCPPTTTTGPATTTTSACTPARCVYECQGTSWVQIVSCAGCTCSDDSSVGMPCIESDPNLEFDCVP
jgi:hypothetical protein